MSDWNKVFPPQGETSVTTTTREEKKVHALSYLDTLKVKYGSGGLSQLAGSSAASQGTSLKEKPGNPLVEIVSMGFFGKGESTKVDTQDSGWSVADQWMETRWDKIRYAIGIRDLRAFSYKYTESSTRISVAYSAPKPISKVTLLADESIPAEFNQEQVLRPWILYWISFDDGALWNPIAPMTPGVINNMDGKTIPVAVEVNAGIPAEERDPNHGYVDTPQPVYSVRLKWRIERPTDYPDRTPVLKAYKLRISVHGGLV